MQSLLRCFVLMVALTATACSSITSLFSSPPVDGENLTANYAGLKTQLKQAEQIFETYKGRLPPADATILQRSIWDIKYLVLPEADKVLAQPSPSLSTPQVDLLIGKGKALYDNIEGVVQRNRPLITKEEDAALVELGGRVREAGYLLEVSRATGKLEKEKIDRIVQLLSAGVKMAVDVAL